MRIPEWQISSQDYFARLVFTIAEFEKRLKLPKVKEVKKILPFRDLVNITAPPIPIAKELLLISSGGSKRWTGANLS